MSSIMNLCELNESAGNILQGQISLVWIHVFWCRVQRSKELHHMAAYLTCSLGFTMRCRARFWPNNLVCGRLIAGEAIWNSRKLSCEKLKRPCVYLFGNDTRHPAIKLPVLKVDNLCCLKFTLHVSLTNVTLHFNFFIRSSDYKQKGCLLLLKFMYV